MDVFFDDLQPARPYSCIFLLPIAKGIAPQNKPPQKLI